MVGVPLCVTKVSDHLSSLSEDLSVRKKILFLYSFLGLAHIQVPVGWHERVFFQVLYRVGY